MPFEEKHARSSCHLSAACLQQFCCLDSKSFFGAGFNERQVSRRLCCAAWLRQRFSNAI